MTRTVRVLCLVAGAVAVATPTVAQTNLALGRPAVASSIQESVFPAGAAVDGNPGTRWSSAAADPQWIYVDLGTTVAVSRVTLVWETAHGSAYQIQVSNNAADWTTVRTVTGGDGGTDDLAGLTGSGRYVRMLGTTRATPWGYSLWEMQVYGGGTTATPTPTPTPAGYVEVTPAAAAVTASTHDGNLPGNTVDNNLGTRWSANGDGQWIRFDLGTARTLGYVRIAFYSGNQRQSRFDVQTSTDGMSWSNALTGAASSGTSTAEQTFDFADRPARYVRYLGHGNSVNAWNSLTEVSLFATGTTTVPTPTPTPTPIAATPTPTPTPTPTTTPDNTCPTTSNIALGKPAYAWYWDNGGGAPHYAVDGNGDTRYSHLWYPSGPATAWWYVDLGATTATITGINITWEAAVAADFQLQTSNDATGWTTIQTVTNNASLNTNYTFSPGRTGRYARILMTRKATAYGYSFFELQVMGCRAGNPAPTPTPTPLSGTYALVWADNFDGTALNTSNWTYENDAHFNGEAQQYTTSNVTVGGGLLRITARREDNNGYQFTSGRIITKNLRSWRYGRVVARMLMPVGEGYWPAFWMMGADADTVGWPGNGEIDIMENIGYPSWVSGALHGPGHWGAGSVGGVNNLPSGSVNAWHTYAVEWDPTYVRWYIDDVLVRTVTRAEVTANGQQWVYDNAKFILLNLALGGDYPQGYNGCNGNPLPAGCYAYGLKQTTVDNIIAGQGVVQVDYVQVWQRQ